MFETHFSRSVSRKKDIMVSLGQLNLGAKVQHACYTLSAVVWQNTDGKTPQ